MHDNGPDISLRKYYIVIQDVRRPYLQAKTILRAKILPSRFFSLQSENVSPSRLLLVTAKMHRIIIFSKKTNIKMSNYCLSSGCFSVLNSPFISWLCAREIVQPFPYHRVRLILTLWWLSKSTKSGFIQSFLLVIYGKFQHHHI